MISFMKAPINFTATVSVGLIPLGTDRGEGTPAPNPEKVRWSRPAPRPVEQGLAKRKIRGEACPPLEGRPGSIPKAYTTNSAAESRCTPGFTDASKAYQPASSPCLLYTYSQRDASLGLA